MLSQIAGQSNVRFISLIKALCNTDGCITHTDKSKSDLLSWDNGHLTTGGARFVLRALNLQDE